MPKGKRIKSRTYKIWTTIEEHIVYTDGSDEYFDMKDENTSCLGEFKKLDDAVEQVEYLGVEHRNDGDCANII